MIPTMTLMTPSTMWNPEFIHTDVTTKCNMAALLMGHTRTLGALFLCINIITFLVLVMLVTPETINEKH